MKVGLFFGSFNPIHVGHLIIANTIVDKANLDRVWFVVSPQNPFKEKKSLLGEFDRYDMVKMAIGDNDKLDVSDVEFKLPQPSYTIDTLTHLKERFPSYDFSIIMGGDNLINFHKWKNYQAIVDYHHVITFPRPGKEIPAHYLENEKVTITDTPLLQVSATYIRDQIKANNSTQYLLPDTVRKHIEEKGFYL